MGKYKKELLFTLAVLAAAAGLWLATHAGRGTGNVAVVRYGDPQVEQRIDLSQNADYDIDTGTYTVHLHVENGGIAFVNSPCPDHLCEGFGILQNAGDWAACMPARTSITIEEKSGAFMNPTFKQVTKTRYVQLVAELAQEIFVQHYTKLTPKVAAALADKYQSDILTDDEIHSGVINYFLIYLGTEPVGYFALDLGPAGAMCLSRLFIKEKARGQGIGRSIVAYAQKLAEGDGRSRLYLRIWARDLKAEGFAKKCRFRKAETVPMEVLPGTTLDITTWEKLWR